MSIANNHLSKYGRFGDTEIAKTSTGDLWHVNKHEKKFHFVSFSKIWQCLSRLNLYSAKML